MSEKVCMINHLIIVNYTILTGKEHKKTHMDTKNLYVSSASRIVSITLTTICVYYHLILVRAQKRLGHIKVMSFDFVRSEPSHNQKRADMSYPERFRIRSDL